MKRLEKMKYLIAILIFTVISSISILCTAQTTGSWRFEPDGKGYYATSHNGEDLVFCVELGAPLKNNLEDNLPQFYNNKEIFCNYCKDSAWRPGAAKDGSKIGYTSEMEDPEIIDYEEHQDIAYALAFETNQEKIQTVIWKSSLDASGGSDEDAIVQSHLSSVIKYVDDEGLAEEAKAYKKFYEEKEAAGGFKPIDKTDYKAIKVIANQEDNTYLIGKFNIDYTKGIFKIGEKVAKFGYIDKIILKDQDGNELEIADIIDTQGESIMSRGGYHFPDSQEDFYIKFKADPDDEIEKVYMNANFKYLDICQATMIKWTGKIYEWGYTKQYVTPSAPHKKNCTYHAAKYVGGVLVKKAYYSHENCHYKEQTHYYGYYYELKKAPFTSSYDSLNHTEAQDLLTVEPIGDEGNYAKPIWKEVPLYEDGEPEEIRLIDLRMEMGGRVFLDVQQDKDTSLTNVNGKYDEGTDKPLADVEVTLYEVDKESGETTIVDFSKKDKEADEEDSDNSSSSESDKDKKDDEDVEPRMNPTLTDKNGEYSFKKLNSQKKYFVTYQVNGQYLESTMFTAKVEEYNNDSWNVSNMAFLLDEDREEYNKIFETIESAPENYKVVNKIFNNVGDYNKTYRFYEQTYEMGTKEADEMKKLREAIITKIHEYIDTNKTYPNDLAKRAIYSKVASENSSISEVENKIQYILDMLVVAKTASLEDHHAEVQKYPVYDNFVIGNEEEVIGDVKYPAIYDGQKHINCGFIEREKADLKLSKDISSIRVTINGKEYNYRCNRRQNEPVDVDLRGSDIDIYRRDLKESDIQFIDYVNSSEKRLRVYVKYKIRVTNQSNGDITTYITGLNDYYDEDYTYLSSTLVGYNEQQEATTNKLHWENDKENHKLTTTDKNLTSIAIKPSLYVDVYTEFEVTTEALKKVLTEKESTKENYAELTGYKTYYTTDRSFPDEDLITAAGAPAGLVDRDSRPGDFDLTDSKKRYEVETFTKYSYTEEFTKKNGEERTKESLNVFQDDADKAPGLKLILQEVLRELNGNVWEDSVLSDILKNENIRRGDGINNDNKKIKDMKVELIDMYQTQNVDTEPYKYTTYNKVADIYNSDEKAFKSAVTYTDANGAYQFKGYVPGDYLIRFTYGEGKTLTTDSNGKVYNGQDYKSTLYAEGNHNIGTEETPNYWYDRDNDDCSDAHDNFGLRNAINAKNTTMNNHIATVLDYKASSGDVSSDATLKELQERSIMFAETNKLILEVEYAKTESENDDESLKEYKVNNVDFGIVERPRSELTLTKDVKNIRVIGNNGTPIFDNSDEAPNLAWIKPSSDPYSGENGKINPIVDENLLHGGTIKLLYEYTVTNTGEKDYVDGSGKVDEQFYNTGKASGTLVKTKADYVVDYVENNLKFNSDDNQDAIDKNSGYNKYWKEIADKNELNSGDVNKLVNLDMSVINGYTTIIKTTDDSPLLKELSPADKGKKAGDSTSTTLLLTKVLNTENDDLVYDNSAEVLQTHNDAGRRSYNNLDATKNDVSETVTSIPGNHNPTATPTVFEPDANNAETVVVDVPFGEKNYWPIIIAVAVAGIFLAGGIFIIKKKVIDK